jgi:hypothetical protein
MKVAPLLRFVTDVNMAEAFFTNKLKRALLQNERSSKFDAEVFWIEE